VADYSRGGFLPLTHDHHYEAVIVLCRYIKLVMVVIIVAVSTAAVVVSCAATMLARQVSFFACVCLSALKLKNYWADIGITPHEI